MVNEALTRLREAIQDKKPVDRRQGLIHHCSYAEVSPHDVLEVGALIKTPTERSRAIINGSQDPGENNVHLKVTDLAYLIDEATKATSPATVPPAGHETPPG